MGSSRKLFFAALAGALVNTAIVLANGFLIAAIIVGIIYSHPTVEMHLVSLAALWTFRALFTSQFERWASDSATKIKAELRSQVLSSPAAVRATPSAHLSTVMIKGANSLDIYLARFLPQMFGAAVTPMAVIAALFFLDMASALIAIVTIPIIPLFGALIGKFTNDAVTAKWRTLGTLSQYFEDSLRGLQTLAIFGRHKSQGIRIQEMGDRYTSETMKVLRISFLSALVLELAATISVALIAVSVGIRLVNDSIAFFPSLAVLVLAPEVYFPLRNAASLFHASADGGAALAEIGEIAQSSASLDAPLLGEHQKIEGVTSIAWSEWKSTFGQGRIDSTSLSSGDVLVIRGSSGLGKSTFLNSLLGFDESASVMINNLPASSVDKDSLFQHVGWIPQSPSLISGSLRELFALVKPGIRDQEIIDSLEEVGLPLSQLPAGLDTHVGGQSERSGQISGGQRRRIAIARALLRNPSLIIADEPSADLDSHSARHILNLLREKAISGAIVIAVLHAPDQKILGSCEVVMEER